MQDTMTFPLTHQGVRDLNAVKEPVLPVSGGPATRRWTGVNVGDTERLLSSLAGAGMVIFGLARRNLTGLGTAAAGAAMMYRGLSGFCSLYNALGVNTAGDPKGTRAEVVYRR